MPPHENRLHEQEVPTIPDLYRSAREVPRHRKRSANKGSAGWILAYSALLLCLIPVACSTGNQSRNDEPGDIQDSAAGEIESSALDIVERDGGKDVEADGASEIFPSPPYEAPDDLLRVSTAEGKIFAPLGISTAGYGQSPGEDAPQSPFAKGFQATTEIVHPPGVRVVHLLKGERRIVLVQTDLVGIYYLFYERIVELVKERSGVDLRESMVLMANHSHTGPGRIVNFVIGGALADAYNEVIFEEMMKTISEAIISAITQEALPSKFSAAFVEEPRIHKDRRCENPEHSNDLMGILRFDEAGTNNTIAVVLNYAMHGTIFGASQGKLSGDAPRSVELKVQEVLPGEPLVLFAQSWGGDMAPSPPPIEGSEVGFAANHAPKLDELEAIGRAAAESVLSVWDSMEFEEDPALGFRSAHVPMSHELLGYDDEIFPYEFGGAFCGGVSEFCPESEKEPKMHVCIGIPEEYSLSQTRLTAMRIGSVAIVTLPGEPVTTLGEYLLDLVREQAPSMSAMLFGYAQDYTGYLLLPDDWYGGGYESASNFWGPYQGRYLADSAASLAGILLDPQKSLSFEPVEAVDYVPGEGDVYEPDRALDLGSIAMDVPSTVKSGELLEFSWNGGDPWLDNPSVVLEKKGADGQFSPFRAGGRVVDERGYRFVVSMVPDPPWGAEEEGETGPVGRHFVWKTTLRTAVQVPAPQQVLTGSFQIRVMGRGLDEEGVDRSYELASSPVSVSE